MITKAYIDEAVKTAVAAARERENLFWRAKFTKLHLQPGDTVIVTTDAPITEAQARELKGFLKDFFPQNMAVIVEKGVNFKVKRTRRP